MALEIKQQLKLSQQLVLTPQLQQAIKLLQLSQMELVEMVGQELLENPLLEEVPSGEEGGVADFEPPEPSSAEPGVEAEAAPVEQSQEVGGQDGDFSQEPFEFDWENYIDSYHAPEFKLDYNEDLPGYEATLANRTSLLDHLAWQLKLSSFDEVEVKVARMILSGINEDGYFQESLEEFAEASGESLDFVEHVLGRVQEFDPPGVAARDLKECLRLQVKQLGKKLGDSDLLGRVIEEFLPLLERRDYGKIAKELKLPVTKIADLARVIHELEPRPGRPFSGGEAHYITPDVYVRKVSGEWMVSLNEDGLPKLKVNPQYRSMVENQGPSSTKNYVQDKLKSAIWLIRSIHQRQRTLYKTATTIVKLQQDFLEKGLDYIKPMVLRDVADAIEMHESTVSRVTTSKYMHTPHGIFELKFFFTNGLATTEGGENMAAEAIKNKIKTLILQEDAKSPLSDQDIAERLSQEQKVEIARRTVAKYREMMGVASSSKRRKLY